MAAIPSNFGAAGVGLDPVPGINVNLATILRDISDDLGALKGLGVAAIIAPAASDLPSALTLVNEIRTKLNAVSTASAAASLKTSKGP